MNIILCRYLKYLTKKYLKKNNLRDWLRVVASGKDTYELRYFQVRSSSHFLAYANPLKAELNPICHLLALLGAHHILHVNRIMVNADQACFDYCVLVLPQMGRCGMSYRTLWVCVYTQPKLELWHNILKNMYSHFTKC
jgi:hypothetical protein